MAAQRLRTLGVSVPPRSQHPATRANRFRLTVRQQEVLALIADGLTDAQIAGRLFLTTRTVNHHVAAILAKLGVSSRAEAARAWRQPP
jgi:DNA-binding NarL/FixJ family response regulator